MKQNHMSFGAFVNKILAGTAPAIVVALIPNAILATFLKLAPNSTIAVEFLHVVQVFQFFTPLMSGVLIAQQFGFNAMQMITVGGAAQIGSGAWTFKTVEVAGKATGLFQLAGIGDLINMMITAGLAVYAIMLVGNKFGSLTIVLLPILIGTGVGYIGWKILPYVSYITTFIGNIINSFTNLQPVLMCILIAISFALLIVSPISTVAIGLAIGLNGMSAAAAAMGVATTAVFLVWATYKNNKAGVPIAIFLGAMKMMMPNFLKHPIMSIPMAITAAISSLTIPLFQMTGTPATAGFGLVGFVGPIASLASPMMNIVWMLVCWIVIPFAVAYVTHRVCKDVLHLYNEDIFKFEG